MCGWEFGMRGGLYFLVYILFLSFSCVLSGKKQSQLTISSNSSPNIIKFHSPSYDLVTFFLAFGNGIRLSTLLNCSLLLPNELTLYSHSLPSTSSKSRSSIPIHDIFNISKLRILLMEKYSLELILESDIIDHKLRLYHSILKYTSIRDIIIDLQNYLKVNNTVLDVGNLFLRIIDTDCPSQEEMAKILHYLLICFPNSFNTFLSSLGSHLSANYNAIESPRIELTKTERSRSLNFSGVFTSSSTSSSSSSSDPIYLTRGGHPPFHEQLNYLSSLSLLKQMTTADQRLVLQNPWFQYLIDLKVAIGAQQFAGVSSSPFSHFVVSERLYRNRSSVNLCLDLPTHTSFTANHHSMLGAKSPDVTCSHLKHLQSSYSHAALQEIIYRIPKVFKTIGLDHTLFNSVMYLLSFEPRGYVLPLIFTFFDIHPYDPIPLFHKINTLFLDAKQQILVKAGLKRALNQTDNEDNPPPLHLLMVIHNSHIQGAPLMAYYLAKELKEKLNVRVDFFVDERSRGALESRITSEGMTISTGKNLSLINTTLYDLIYLNTIVSWYHEDLPQIFQLYSDKCIMYVHESLREEVFALFPSSKDVMSSARGLIYVTSRSMAVYDDILHDREMIRSQANRSSHHYVIGNSLSASMILQSQMKSERDHVRSKLGLSPTDILFVTSGDIYLNRNQLLLVDAANLLLTRLHPYPFSPSPNVYFLIIGVMNPKSKYTKSVYRHVLRSKFKKHFILMKKKPHHESLVYMAAGDVYISLAKRESFGLALLEAMTMGLPVIVSKLDGVPDVIYEEALDVNLNSTESVTKAMKAMLSPATRNSHSSLSQARSQHFQQQFFFLRHLQVINRLLSQG